MNIENNLFRVLNGEKIGTIVNLWLYEWRTKDNFWFNKGVYG
jgi:hypothetical protein